MSAPDIFRQKFGEPRPAIAQDAKPKPVRRRLSSVRPNVGIELAYRKKLQELIRDLTDSVEYWMRAAYRKNEPVMAQDATPAKELQKRIASLADDWEAKINATAPKLAAWFAKQAADRSDAQLKSILRQGGMTVRYRMTAAMRDVFQATVAENVGLIKSIPQQYLGQVQGLVMRSVAEGRDLEFLTRELKRRYTITLHRAKLIALDQNNKITSALTRVRQVDLGIEEGIWQHSGAGREPRPTHVQNDGKTFSLAEGWYDPDPKVRRRILPGQLINCRCTWRPVVKGFS